MKKILVLAALPDDETLGCGGTIHRLNKEGHEIQLLTFTDGEGSRGITKKIEMICYVRFLKSLA